MEIIKELFINVFLSGIVLLFFSGLVFTAFMFLLKYLGWLYEKLFPIKDKGE